MVEVDSPGFLDDTREELTKVAFELIERDGFARTTAADIAKEAGFTERTFFRYFPTKEDVVFSHWEGRFDEYVPYIRKYISRHGLTVDSLIEAIFEAGHRDPSQREPILQALTFAKNNPELDRRLSHHRRWITDRVAEAAADALGQDPPDLSVKTIAAVAVTVLGVATDHWVDSGQQGSVRELIADTRRLAEAGLSHGSGGIIG